jgi:ADP-ribose pyrophosphatase YjhB (NUDIX family)
MNNEALTLLEQILKFSITGERFAKDGYNKERYEAIRESAEKLYQLLPEFENIRLEPLDKIGYLTPKVGVNAIIKNDRGEILLERRMDDKCWGIPGGWAEVGLTVEENVIKEMKEEAGVDVSIERILDVISRKPTEKYLHTSYHVIFECKITQGTITISHESEEMRWRKIDEVTPWHADHYDWITRLKSKGFI